MLTTRDLAQQYTTLVQRGQEWVGLCPLHNEKTPSFTVSTDNGLFYCFGCGMGGDVYTLLMRKERCSFPEAKRRLGLDVFRNDSAQRKRERMRALQHAYRTWQGQTNARLSDEYRQVCLDLEAAKIACQQLRRRPDLYSAEDQLWWARQHGQLVGRKAALTWLLDLLVYPEHREQKFHWWRVSYEETGAP